VLVHFLLYILKLILNKYDFNMKMFMKTAVFRLKSEIGQIKQIRKDAYGLVVA